MVDPDDAEAAATSLRSVIAGLGELVADWACQPEPSGLQQRLAQIEKVISIGADILAVATAATVVLRRAHATEE